ncbi:acylase [Pedobacter sp. HMF7647]|uniref:Acylase n=1 Tax=Hufsiella arboris TaxID=2695275 RepID=A0A7K1Y9N1_9SPHI|nr:acylase [Hufsiella arboris]MXV50768.1 acylase [Hufsiella arboris]
MKRCTLVLFALFIFFVTPVYSNPAKIEWDRWGVPHISAASESDLFFAQGWAQMQAHANLVLKIIGTARGKAAEYWGPEYEESDMLVHTLNFPNIAASFRKTQDSRLQRIITSFTGGMNAWAKAHPNGIEHDKRVVLPLVPDDVNLQMLHLFILQFVGGTEFNRASNWQERGSNAYAISSKKSASGSAMLVQNPHLPWSDEFTWFECQLTLNGRSVYGANLLCFPGIGIGFNENLGWTHTNNTLDNADSFNLTLANGGYILDGKQLSFETRPDTIWVKQGDGKLLPKAQLFYSSVHGPVLKMGRKNALAIKVAGTDRPDALLQWWKMANSDNFGQFESALKMQQIPFWNVMYADKKGDIFYLFNGMVPKRSYGTFETWNTVVDGASSKNIWNGYLTYDELPKLKNPASGWLQNANDPPWTVTLPRELNKQDFPPYIAPNFMSLRPQQAANMLLEDSLISFDRLVEHKLSTHVLLADRVLDDLLSSIDSSASPQLLEAKKVLASWDRCADSDSRGMLLFYAWAMAFNPMNDYNYAVHWDENKPNTTPSGIRDKKRAVQLLGQAAREVRDRFGDIAVPWGTYNRLKRNGIDLPANGADGAMGVFRVASSQRDGLTARVVSGDSWVGIIEFGKKVRAKVLLSYGNSSQDKSPHNGDQLKLFSEKKLRDAWFYPQQLAGNIAYTEIRKNDTFIRK